MGVISRTGGLAPRAIGALAAMLLVPVSGAPTAGAATVTVSCDGQTDIADVQAAVDGASLGDTIQLRGTCDFSPALAHGGSVSSIDATAVLIRPGSPVTDLVIEPAPNQQATIVGAGTQTAFAIAPGNDRVTIRGLRFVNLGRPVVVLGASGATIGDAAPTVPAPNGNRMLGDGQLNSAVLGVADSSPHTVRFGAGGSAPGSPATFIPGLLDDLTVTGNQITYSPTAPAEPSGARDVVGVDVRQVGTAQVDGVTVTGNAIAMFGAELTSLRHNGVRIEGRAAVPASPTPSPADYRIHDVTVSGNNLGRFEELDAARISGVDPDRQHGAGRVGVLLIRVEGFTVAQNMVRTRLTGSALAGPGGGVVASDSAFGSIEYNDVSVGSDASVPERSDLGGVGVFEALPTLWGGSGADQATTAVDVVGNVIGHVVTTPYTPRRSLVVSGADDVTVWGNSVVSRDVPSLFIGADVGTASTALPRTVTRTVACSNILDGVHDTVDETSFGGTTSSTGNAFPGGAAVAGNGECAPTATTSPAPPAQIPSGGSLTVAGRAWASRPLDVTLVDEAGAQAVKTLTATADGTYSVVFTSTDLTPLADGALWATAVARDEPGRALGSTRALAIKNYVVNPPPAGTVTIRDGDGYTNALELVAGIDVEWTTGTTRPTLVTLRVVDSQGATPPACPAMVRDATGRERLPYDCGLALAQGTFEVRARWQASDGEQSTIVADSSVKDSVLPTVTIGAPGAGSTLASSTVTVSGTVDEPGQVTVRTAQWPGQVLATTTVAVAGPWSVDVTLANGDHQITAFATDGAANDGPTAPARSFSVNDPGNAGGGGPVDTTPPDAPVVTGPPDGSVQGASFVVGGTAEPGATAWVFVDGSFVTNTPVGSNGLWAVVISPGTGTHAIDAVASDAAGNVSARSATVTVEVDATPPTLTISTPPDTVFTPTQPVAINGDASDTHNVQAVVVEYWSAHNNSGPVTTDVATCTPGCPAGSVAWTSSPGQNLTPGVHSVRVVASDAFGNTVVRTLRFFKVA